MEGHVMMLASGSAEHMSDDGVDMIRRGPWTAEEDAMLKSYVTVNGECRWNSVARCAGLKRTGKSCRLRWLNYLRPDVRRGNISLKEQLLILELHSRWGNRWSKIAQYLPGRTDNEIKNYWRTRVQKQAKQLKCDVNSKQFRDAMRYVWIPRMMERIRAASEPYSDQPAADTYSTDHCSPNNHKAGVTPTFGADPVDPYFTPAVSGTSSESSEAQVSSVSDLTECYDLSGSDYPNNPQNGSVSCQPGLEIQALMEQSNGWFGGGDSWDGLWSDENMWFLQQQLSDGV